MVAPTAAGGFLRRGLTVAAFNLLETFLADRWQELATHMNGGHTQFLDLPDRMQKRAISRTLSVAKAKIPREPLDLSDLRRFSSEVGASLSAVSTSLNLSPFTWMWEGSNISADEYASGLRHIHVDRPFENILNLSGRLGFPVIDAAGDPMNLGYDLKSLALERHKCAHVASHGVTTIWLRAVPDRILRFALGFDVFASVGAHMIRSGDQDFLSDEKWLTSDRVMLRFVRERARDHAELLEARTRAAHVDADGEKLFREACGRAGPGEVVVRQNRSGLVCEWSIGSVG